MDMNYAKAISERNGQHWFDEDVMRYFNSRVLESSWTKIDDDTYRFISSERMNFNSPRLYTVRQFTISTGTVDTVGEFQRYKTSREALKNIRN